MTSIKIVQFSRPLTPLVHLRPKFIHPLDLGRPISKELPITPTSNDNQSIKKKPDPRMTLGPLSFSVSPH